MEEEAAWYSRPTELTTTPVAVGIRAAPKKRRDHRRGIIYTKLFKKPIGAAKINARVPNPAHNLIAVNTFFPL